MTGTSQKLTVTDGGGTCPNGCVDLEDQRFEPTTGLGMIRPGDEVNVRRVSDERVQVTKVRPAGDRTLGGMEVWVEQ